MEIITVIGTHPRGLPPPGVLLLLLSAILAQRLGANSRYLCLVWVLLSWE